MSSFRYTDNSAAALHWTNPDGRWVRMAALVQPGGVFASFGVPIQLADPALKEAVRAARAPYLETDDIRAALAYAAWRSEETELPLE